jgi:hypothetical protein
MHRNDETTIIVGTSDRNGADSISTSRVRQIGRHMVNKMTKVCNQNICQDKI